MAESEVAGLAQARQGRHKSGSFASSFVNLRGKGRKTSREIKEQDADYAPTPGAVESVSLKGHNGTSSPMHSHQGSQDKELPPIPSRTDSDMSLRTPTSPVAKRGSVDATPTNEEDAYFDSYRLSRPGSIYSLSRVSFSSQISQLTSIQTPQASALASSISSMATSVIAARALKDAAEQLQKWTRKASEVLTGLEAEDDVEWAAAAGREGLEEVDVAITRFEGLIQVYVGAVEDLQTRKDISSVPGQDLTHLVDQIEEIAKEWQKVKDSLQNVKYQVELAMEWEELWNNVLGDIGQEIEALSSLVFEMEERRYKTNLNDTPTESGNIDINELENIVDSPTTQTTISHRFSLAPAFPQSSPLGSPGPSAAQEETNLLSLFARMQPLRASLDFLPMRLAAFHNRASAEFPTACDELQKRRTTLEQQWKRLESDAEALRRELGEDRWVLVFKNAGKQALKMMDSVVRSISKLDEALDSNTQLSHAPNTGKKVDNYEAKKLHYGPAIERVITIVEKGVKDRLTVNGEIIRLQSDLRQKWQTLQADIRNMDAILTHFNGDRHKHSRDSSSTVFSSEHSFAGSNIDTPGSSPASSTYLPSRQSSDEHKSPSYSASRQLTTPKPRDHRHSSLPVPSPTSASSRAASTPTKSTYVSPYSQAAIAASTPPVSKTRYRPASTALPERTRWNASTSMNGTVVGHTARPLAVTTPSPYRRSTPRPPSSAASSSATPTPSRRISATLSSPTANTPQRPSSRPPSRFNLGPGPYAQARRAPSAHAADGASSPLLSSPVGASPLQHLARPPSALALAAGRGRRGSLLPLPTGG